MTRGTGTTTRLLDEAMSGVLTGSVIWFVTASLQQRRYCFDITRSRPLAHLFEFDGLKLSLTSGRGRLMLVSIQQEPCQVIAGHRGEILFDHAPLSDFAPAWRYSQWLSFVGFMNSRPRGAS